MELDLRIGFNGNGQLKFIVNGKDYGIAYDSIAWSQYRAMVGLSEMNDCVELLKYGRTKYW